MPRNNFVIFKYSSTTITYLLEMLMHPVDNQVKNVPSSKWGLECSYSVSVLSPNSFWMSSISSSRKASEKAFGFYLYYNVVGLWACHNGVYRLSKVNSECEENEQNQNKNNNKIIANLKFCWKAFVKSADRNSKNLNRFLFCSWCKFSEK